MNILFVNDIPFNPIGGGIERVTDVLTKELIKRGHKVYYLCDKLSMNRSFLLDYEFPTILYQLPNDGRFANNENVVFYEFLQTNLRIDLVINQRGWGGAFNEILPITHTKLVSVIHSTPDSNIKTFLNNIVELSVPPCVELKKILKKIFYPIVYLYWKKKAYRNTSIAYNKLAQFSDVIVTLSANYNGLLNRFINKPHKAKIISIPNPTSFSVVDFSYNTKDNVILYVGRLEKAEKKPLRLLKIWKYLHKKNPDWILKIVGDGSEKKIMQDYVQKYSISNVIFEGRQSDVISYYKKASFVCLTSDFEGFPMVLPEGMQYGCIPFSFDSFGAATDIIDDGVNGCLIPAFNLEKYANRLSELMNDENKRIDMSRAAIEKVKMFSIENVVNQWEDVFDTLKKKI